MLLEHVEEVSCKIIHAWPILVYTRYEHSRVSLILCFLGQEGQKMDNFSTNHYTRQLGNASYVNF